MPTYGGLAPGAERYGGSPTRVAEILQSLNAQMGTAYNVSTTSPIYYRNLALARCIAAGWDAVESLGKQLNPLTVTQFLARWERIFALVPSPTDTDADRRLALLRRWETFGRGAGAGTLHEVIAAIFDPLGIDFTFVTDTDAEILNTWPHGMARMQNIDGGPSLDISGVPSIYIPIFRATVTTGGFAKDGGAVLDVSLDDNVTSYSVALPNFPYLLDGTSGLECNLTLTPQLTAPFQVGQRYISWMSNEHWTSTAACIVVSCSKPQGMPNPILLEAIATARNRVERLVPAWCDISFAIDTTFGQRGFFLGTENNLNYQRLG